MDNIYLSYLFDYYGCLLTEKQRKYFMDYYFNDLSLQEISENELVSRNAVHKTIKGVENKLVFYENNLHLYENRKKIEKILVNEKEELISKIMELV